LPTPGSHPGVFNNNNNNNNNNNTLFYMVEQYNVIIDVLGGYSKHLEKSVRKLLGARARGVLERMQKSVISNTFNVARTFEINA